MTRWTEERRRKQAEAIRRWKPWENSTGPRTAKGKEKASTNAYKHGGRATSRKTIKKALRLQREFMRHIDAFFAAEAREKKILENKRTIKKCIKNKEI